MIEYKVSKRDSKDSSLSGYNVSALKDGKLVGNSGYIIDANNTTTGILDNGNDCYAIVAHQKESGIGKGLLEKVVDCASKKGCKSFIIHGALRSSIGFYKKVLDEMVSKGTIESYVSKQDKTDRIPLYDLILKL